MTDFGDEDLWKRVWTKASDMDSQQFETFMRTIMEQQTKTFDTQKKTLEKLAASFQQKLNETNEAPSQGPLVNYVIWKFWQ